MEIVIETPKESHGIGMWEVVLKSKESGFTRKIVTGKWSRARDIARDAAGRGMRASFRRYFTDVLIADRKTGNFILVAKRMDPLQASRLSYDYAKVDRDAGITLWPHGSPTPKSWTVVIADDLIGGES